MLALAAFILRKPIAKLVPSLIDRLQEAEVAGNRFILAPAATGALQDTIKTGAEEYKDSPEKLVEFVRQQISKLEEIQKATPTVEKQDLSDRSILWVDDNPLNNVYEANVLKRLGASILFARSTQEALTFLRSDQFDLIISDMGRVENSKMNHQAGYELMEAISKSSRKLPIIFYAGNVARIDSNRSRMAFGVADTPSYLVNLVVRALQRDK